jgi:hypothetical protein
LPVKFETSLYGNICAYVIEIFDKSERRNFLLTYSDTLIELLSLFPIGFKVKYDAYVFNYILLFI